MCTIHILVIATNYTNLTILSLLQSSGNQPQPQREPRQSRRSQQDRPPAERKQGGLYGSRSLPDSYQIFVGGLPPNTTDVELRSVFDNYGPIVEVRTNVKNFGFIVFDNEDSVRQIMQITKEIEPFKIRGKSLNIEEKKPSDKRGGTGMSGGPPSGGRRQPPTSTSAASGGSSSSNRVSKGGSKPPPPRRN